MLVVVAAEFPCECIQRVVELFTGNDRPVSGLRPVGDTADGEPDAAGGDDRGACGDGKIAMTPGYFLDRITLAGSGKGEANRLNDLVHGVTRGQRPMETNSAGRHVGHEWVSTCRLKLSPN